MKDEPILGHLNRQLYWVVRTYPAAKFKPMSAQEFSELALRSTPPTFTAHEVTVDVLDPLTPDGLPYTDARRYL